MHHFQSVCITFKNSKRSSVTLHKLNVSHLRFSSCSLFFYACAPEGPRTLSELSENDWCPCSHNCVITTLWNMIISPCRLCSNYWIGDDGRVGLRWSLCLLLDLTTAISSPYTKCTQGINWNNSLRWEVNVKDWRSCKQTAERCVNVPQTSKGSGFIGRVFQKRWRLTASNFNH